jgi:transposase
MPAGRPTKYKPEYCEMIVEHMAKGYTLETFAATIDTSKNTIYEWEKAHQEFRDACARARIKCQMMWETEGIHGLHNGMNSSHWAFNMKNRFGWKDKIEVDQQTAITGSIGVDLVQMTEGEKIKLLKKQAEELEKLNAIDVG